MPDAKTYSGACHCGRVRYDVATDLGQVLECNCSHCQIKGLLLTFVPTSQFTLHSGEQELSDYQFNKKTIQHLFCKTCGVQPFARGKMPDGTPMVAVNVRCLEGVNPEELSKTPFNGRDM